MCHEYSFRVDLLNKFAMQKVHDTIIYYNNHARMCECFVSVLHHYYFTQVYIKNSTGQSKIDQTVSHTELTHAYKNTN